MLFNPVQFADGSVGFEVYDHVTDTRKVVTDLGVDIPAPDAFVSLERMPDTPLPEITFNA